MLVTPLGIVTEVRLSQPQKALLPMLVNCEFSGNVIELRPSQPLKASFPILVTLSGRVIEVRLVRMLNAEGLIALVPSLTSIEVFVGIAPLYLYNILLTYTTPLG
jgi:hypothetical protein